ncbi:MAG TPA: cyclic nucleotide-binding domain-containing protein [Thermoplasmata archaeon]|nr:cyclic nucleotide-binding domain-containing protein [Thermoplasmata archaeon]
MSGRATGPPPLRLADHRFVHGMEKEFLELLNAQVYERTYETGELLVREGDPAEEFLLIFHGKVALEILSADRPRTTIQTIGAGEVLGWSWLFPPHRWRLDARAVKTTRVLGIGAAYLRRVLDEHPAAAYRFLLRLLPVIAQRLENTQLQLLDIHGG